MNKLFLALAILLSVGAQAQNPAPAKAQTRPIVLTGASYPRRKWSGN